jgi:hypothetical protein
VNRPAKTIIIALLPLLAACSREIITNGRDTTFVPAPPSYADAASWHIERDDNGSSADVFYIPSTWEFDWYTADSAVSHFADPANPAHHADIETEMTAAAAYMADRRDFYSPHYRHITLDSWATLNEDTINRRFRDVAFVDIKNAWDHYISSSDSSRPFILAGFSQGAKAVVELLKIMPQEQRQRLVAAYVLGYKVTPDDIAAAPWIKAAADSTDTGVTICYNSVADVSYIKPVVSAPNVMAINPVNWRVDGTPATLNDTITVTLDTTHKVLVLKGFDGSYLPNILNILNVGDYHGVEPWLYSECLRRNMAARVNAFKNR